MKKFTNLLKDEKIMRHLTGFFLDKDNVPVENVVVVIVFLSDIAYIMNGSIEVKAKTKIKVG